MSIYEQKYYSKVIYSKETKGQIEGRKVTDILSILMPKFVQEQLQNGITQLSKDQGNVTILFCDICNFDDLITCQSVSIIQFLNNIFRTFDNMCIAEGVQKIETVGKTYMGACGLKDVPLPNQIFNSTQRVLNLAFSIMNYIQKNHHTVCNGKPLIMKIGIHYGKVFAGVIGYHKPQFSLIGDTVNTTSRICSTGLDGMITLSEAAFSHLNSTKYKFNIRSVNAKGKGTLQTFYIQHNQSKQVGTHKRIIKSKDENLQLSTNLKDLIHLDIQSPKYYPQNRSPQRQEMIEISTPHNSKRKKTIFCRKSSKADIRQDDLNNVGIFRYKIGDTDRDRGGTALLGRINNRRSSQYTFANFEKPLQSIMRDPQKFLGREKDKKGTYIKAKANQIQFKGVLQIKENAEELQRQNSMDRQPSHKASVGQFSEIHSNNKKNSQVMNEMEILMDVTKLNFYIPDPHFSVISKVNVEQLQTIGRKSSLINPNENQLQDLSSNSLARLESNKIINYMAPNSFKNFQYRMIMLVMTLSFTTMLRWLAKDKMPYFYQSFITRLTYCIFLIWFITMLKKIYMKLSNSLFYFYFAIYVLGVSVFIWESLFIIDLWQLMIVILEVLFIYQQFIALLSLEYKQKIVFTAFLFILLIVFISLQPFILLGISHTIFFVSLALYNNYRMKVLHIRKFQALENLDRQKHAQQKLLVHLLPSHIMEQFLNEPTQYHTLNNIYENCTILFADIAGFTKFADSVEPAQVVGMLRQLFEEFDKGCLIHEVYKLYTIGDCYVVMGVNNYHDRNPVAEAQMVINMGFHMIDIIQEVRERIGFEGLNMRIGIHTGRVIGGVIGTDLIRYDIYGQDVMIANKMESNGKEGLILVSEQTKNLIESVSRDQLEFEYHKDVEIPSLNKVIKSYFVFGYEDQIEEE